MLGAERPEPAGGARRRGDGDLRSRGVDLLDPPGDELLADRGRVGLGQEVLDLVVGRGGDALEDRVGLVVAGLDALEVQDREAAESGQLAGEPGVDHRVHRRREHGDRERDAGERDRDVDVGRLDRLGAGGQRDVLEAVGRPEVVDLRPEHATAGGRRRGAREGAGGLVDQGMPPMRRWP